MFTARAQAELDNDGRCSTFERSAIVDEEGTVRGAKGVYRRLPKE